MKRFGILLILVVCFVLCSCQGSAGMRGSKPLPDSPVAEFFRAKDAVIMKGTITLMEDVAVTESIDFATGELWTINLNGFSIYSAAESPCLRVLSGGVVLKDERDVENSNHGAVYSYYNTGVFVGTEGSFQLVSGEIRAEIYGVEVERAGVLQVSGGAVIGNKLPIYGEAGWNCELKGGFFSSYDKSYDKVIPNRYYPSLLREEANKEYFDEFRFGFDIRKEGIYNGTSQIELEAGDDRDSCFRMYYPKALYSYRGEVAKPVYQWFVKAGEKNRFTFTSGEYVLMVAEGTEWSDTEAYGTKGRYWKMTPYTFKDGCLYAIESGGNMQRRSSLSDFMGTSGI